MNPDLIQELTPADLRGILRYVPQWRNHIFVISMDGALIRTPNFANILLDIAVLKNLQVKIVLVFGIGMEIRRIADQAQLEISDSSGEGPTDNITLEAGIQAAGTIAHKIMQGLTQAGLQCVHCNALRATKVGIVKGIDQQLSGKTDRIDTQLIHQLIENNVVPLVSPIAFSRLGEALRLNADAVSADLAIALKASKLIYLSPFKGVSIHDEFALNITVEEIRSVLNTNPTALLDITRSKARQSVRAVEAGVPRAHIIDGRDSDSLLTEIFHQVGIGTMVYGNDYMQIRKAHRSDIPILFQITRKATFSNELKLRTIEDFEKSIDHFYVYEIDGTIIGTIGLRPFNDPSVVEMEAVFVQSFYQGRGVGKKLVTFAIEESRRQGKKRIITLTTQTADFFKELCGFSETDKSILPQERADELALSKRNSKIFYIDLQE
ncbi:MAG: amino-acid N-acetyltransferase [Opitutales bacterium]|nr:amino-acid N-acetyltransferase [Opitutales bacterium]